ncbi:MAG: vWA domain-containing protein [Frankiaceae bacterium]
MANLLDRTVAFTGALRAAGLPVSTAETVDATRALVAVELLDRESLRAAMAATMCKRPAYRRAFDTLFDLYFPVATGDGLAAPGERVQPVQGPADPAATEDGDEAVDTLRDQLRDLLLDGGDEDLRRLAREAVRRLGRGETQPGRRSWFAYRVLRRLSPETLLSWLLTRMLADDERGGLAEQVARQTVAERLRTFQEAVESEVRRRLAEDRGTETVARTAVKPLTEQVDFLRASRGDLVELRRQVYPLARRLATRLTVRRRLGRAGRLDFRRTVRASLATGGVPLETRHRPHRPHKPELVVLCDISGSVAGFSHFTLMLTHALREQFAKVRPFAFIDTCDEITGYLRGDDLGDVMARIAAEAEVVWFDGHSDYGHTFEVFAERYPDALTPKTSLLVLGDGRNNYRSPALATLKRIVGQARHAYWLNPEPRSYWGSADSAAPDYALVVDEMVECRNVEQLSDFITRLLPV